MSKYELLMFVLFGGWVLLSTIERLWPYRARPRRGRWVNLAMGVCNYAVTRVALPVGLGAFAMHWHTGLLHVVPLPMWAKVAAGVLSLDLVMYGLHNLFHRVHFFWRFHRVHHSDRELDASTGFRFHPGQGLIMLGVMVLAVMAFGLPMLSVFVFALIHELVLLTTHANLGPPRWLDALVRMLFVSPRMHWIHHSAVAPRELDHNFGICFSWWDRLFGTYLARSSAGDDFPFGIEDQPNDAASFLQMLLLPVRWWEPAAVRQRDDRGERTGTAQRSP
ncbi:MAG TPA: sterol desaturase family protein [Gammaproteobacteria bacterium]|nr:sterol desaturase family protein [Gammaproteobacteria bacterium]